MNQDIFPETLLVAIADGHTYTSSLKVAEHFHKQHKDVLRAIKKLLADCPDEDFSRRNFAPRKYQYHTGKGQLREAEIYHLTEEGFALLAMGFTGKQALQWKIDFLTAFRTMETALKTPIERRANALHFLRPHWLIIEQGVNNSLSRQEICVQTGHRSPNTITANKRRMRSIGLLN